MHEDLVRSFVMPVQQFRIIAHCLMQYSKVPLVVTVDAKVQGEKCRESLEKNMWAAICPRGWGWN